MLPRIFSKCIIKEDRRGLKYLWDFRPLHFYNPTLMYDPLLERKYVWADIGLAFIS
jgi:hypothetical protein